MNEIIEQIKMFLAKKNNAMYAAAGGLIFFGCAAALIVAMRAGKDDDYLRKARQEDMSFSGSQDAPLHEEGQKPYEDSIGFLRGAGGGGGGGQEATAPQGEAQEPEEDAVAQSDESQESKSEMIEVGALKPIAAPQTGQSSSQSNVQMTRKLSKLEGVTALGSRGLSSGIKPLSRMGKISSRRGAVGKDSGKGKTSLAKRGSAFGTGGADTGAGKPGSAGPSSAGIGPGTGGGSGVSDGGASPTNSPENSGNVGGGGNGGDDVAGPDGFSGGDVCYEGFLGSIGINAWDYKALDFDGIGVSMNGKSVWEGRIWCPATTIEIPKAGLSVGDVGNQMVFTALNTGCSGPNTGKVSFGDVWVCKADDATQEWKESSAGGTISKKIYLSNNCSETLSKHYLQDCSAPLYVPTAEQPTSCKDVVDTCFPCPVGAPVCKK